VPQINLLGDKLISNHFITDAHIFVAIDNLSQTQEGPTQEAHGVHDVVWSGCPSHYIGYSPRQVYLVHERETRGQAACQDVEPTQQEDQRNTH
jgi:hypothetical protein